MPGIVLRKLGVADYEPTLQSMKELTDSRDQDTADELWLLQHPRVFTQGQAGKAEHVLAPGEIPVIQVREIETMLKIDNSETAVIGGLMQDQINKENRGVPFLSSLPLLGALFSYTEEEYVKSELVIFIRPVVMEDASLNGDLADYKKYLLEDLQQETSEQLTEAEQ